MKKFITIALFIVLATLAIYYSFYRKNSTLWFSDTSFSIKNANAVTRIVIRSPEKKITLYRVYKGWGIDSIEARQDLVENLLKISEELEMVSPVSLSQRDSILCFLKKGTIIEFYSGHRNVSSLNICRFHDEIYAIHDRSKTPYRIDVKGFPEIDLTKLFNPERYLWTANNLFNFHPDDILTVQLFYPDKHDKDFIIEKQSAGKFIIENNMRGSLAESTDSVLLNEYMHFFADIRYYPVKEDKSLIEKNLISKTPFFQLMLSGKNGPLAELQAYKKTELKSGRDDPFEFYAISKKTGLIMLKYNDFDPILAGKDYFLKK